MSPLIENVQHVSRREFFGRSATGLGAAALASMLAKDGHAANRINGLSDLPHFPPKAKRVIYLFQNGGPTHVDLFDYKPKLKEMHGQPVPPEYIGEKRFTVEFHAFLSTMSDDRPDIIDFSDITAAEILKDAP